LFKLIVIIGNCDCEILKKKQEVGGNSLLDCLLISILCPWNLLGWNVFVRNRRRVKIVCKTLMKTERNKKEMKMRKAKRREKWNSLKMCIDW